jgi:hypothetical protein
VGRIERAFPIRAFAFLALWIPISVAAYAWTKDKDSNENVGAGPYELGGAVGFLSGQPPGNGLIARKPHAAFLSSMRFVAMPEEPSLDSLRTLALRERAHYVLISDIEYRTRLSARALTASRVDPPGFRRVFESRGARVYEVVP